MGDPSKQIYLLDEKALESQWNSRSALFFEDIRLDMLSFNKTIWSKLWKFKNYPTEILFAIPALSISTGLLGFALTWMLQKGMTDNMIWKGHVGFCLLLLLFVINIFKSILSLLRQTMMIYISNRLNGSLFQLFLEKLFHHRSEAEMWNDVKIQNGLSDMLKIQNAMLNIITTVLSDGVLLVMMTLALLCYMPWAALLNACTVVFILFIISGFLPGRSYDLAHLNSAAAAIEKLIKKDVQRLAEFCHVNKLDERKSLHFRNQQLYLSQGTTSAIRMNRLMFWIEIAGNINVLAVLTLAMHGFSQGQLPLNTLMIAVILSYLTSAMMPRICGALFVAAEGADAAVQFSQLTDEAG